MKALLLHRKLLAAGAIWAAALANSAVANPAVANSAVAKPAVTQERQWLVGGEAFAPLAADPRWPRFESGLNKVLSADSVVFGESFDNLWTASFGDTVALYSGPPPKVVGNLDRFEVGLMPALHAVLDPFSDIEPLINADYQVGGYLAGKLGPWSAMTRVYHQSSHLGDELLLLGPPVRRFNFSYESWDGYLSRDFDRDVRLYGGAGWIFHETGRGDYGDLHAQYGVEWSPDVGLDGCRPIAAIDVQHLQSLDWQADLSLRVGARFQPAGGGTFDLTIHYYHGRNPFGQFYNEDFESVGVSVRFNF